MKKIFATLLAALMLLSFAACGKNNSKENDTTTTAPETTAPATDAVVTTTAPAAPTTTANTTLPEGGAVIEAGATEVFRGTVSDNTYMSAFSGLTFTADEKWTFLSDADIASMLGVTEDDLKNDKLSSTLTSTGAVYDMYAQLISEDNILDANVLVMLLDANNIDFKDKTLEDTVELLASASFGLDLASAETGSASFGGENYYKVDATTENANVSVFGCKIGDVYVVCASAASKESGIDPVSMFS
ncbi:MAG: hypothetical protein E7566_01535 [Ruminococcaceae bacterium]|nr:hypothetical protein [Oscillospiraceae bacterium]